MIFKLYKFILNRAKLNNPTALMVACSVGDLYSCDLLIKNGAFLSAKNKKGESILHIAIKNRNVEIIELLIKYGADLYYKYKGQSGFELLNNDNEFNHLIKRYVVRGPKTLPYATSSGDIAMVHKILNNNIETMYLLSNQGVSPIYLACKHGYLTILQSLVSKYNANVNINNNIGTSLLHVAIVNKHCHVVSFLLEHNINFMFEDKHKKMGIDIALETQQFDIFEILLPYHINVLLKFKNKNEDSADNRNKVEIDDETEIDDVNDQFTKYKLDSSKWLYYLRQCCKYNLKNSLKLLVNTGIDVNCTTTNGWNAIMIATRYSNVDIIEFLILNGKSKLDIVDNNGWSAFHIACQLIPSVVKLNILKILIDNGSDVNNCTVSGLTPLIQCIQLKDIDSVKLLIQNNVDVNKMYRQHNPIDYALKLKLNSIVGLLVSNGAKLSSLVLWEACRSVNTTLIQHLLEGEFDPTFKHGDDITSLEMAVQKQIPIDLIKKMIEKIKNEEELINKRNKHGYTLLHTSVTFNNVDLVQYLLTIEHVDINCINEQGYQPIHTSLILNNLNITKLLLEHGASVNSTFPSGGSLLSTAIHKRSLKLVELILKYNPSFQINGDFNIIDILIDRLDEELIKLFMKYRVPINQLNTKNMSPLHKLAKKPFSNKIKNIIEIMTPYADVNIVSNNGRSPLHYAVENNRFETVNCLLKTFSSINIDIQDYNGWTPLMTSLSLGYDSISILLLQNNSNINLQNYDQGYNAFTICILKANYNLFNYCLQNCNPDLHSSSKVGKPIDVAMKHNEWTIVDKLITLGCTLQLDSMKNGQERWSILHQACKENNIDIINTLIKAGIDVNMIENHCFTPLQVAVIHFHFDVIQLLLNNGANGETPSAKGWSAVHTMAKLVVKKHMEEEYKETFEMLCKSVTTVNLHEQGGLTPLDISIEADNDVATEILLKFGGFSKKYRVNTNFDHNLSNGWNIYHTLAFNKKSKVITVIKSYLKDSNINSQESRGLFTPLMIAVNNNSVDVVKQLLECGANVLIQNRHEQTALHLAVQKNRRKMVRLLAGTKETQLATIEDDRGVQVMDVASQKGRHSMHNLLSNAFFKGYKQTNQYNLPSQKYRKNNSYFHNLLRYELENDIEDCDDAFSVYSDDYDMWDE